MDRQYVDSSMIESAGYDQNSSILEIEFKSSHTVWEYYDVPEYIWYDFLNSESKGKFFHAYIKNGFNGSQVG